MSKFRVFKLFKFKLLNLVFFFIIPLSLYCVIYAHEYFKQVTRLRMATVDLHLPLTNSAQRKNQKLNIDDIGPILQERKRRLHSYCSGKELEKVGNNDDEVLKKHFYHDIKHNFLYCSVEKIGSTFWKRLLQIISGHSKKSSPFEIVNEFDDNAPTFKDASFDYIHAVLQDSLKFVIARDPYSRLFSAFANKFFLVNSRFRKVVGTRIIRTIRVNASKKALKCGHDITFPEIVKYLIVSEKNNWGRDGHFTPLSDHCRPCQIKYDIIAKIESFKKDTLFVLGKLNMTHIPYLMEDMKNLEESSEMDSIAIVSRHLIENILEFRNCVSKAEGFRRAWRNFQFTGVISKDIRYPLTTEEEKTVTNKELRNMFERAFRASGPRDLRSKNRQLVLEEAYSQVPLPDLLALSGLFKTDCGAFGYDCKPDYIFERRGNPKSNLLDVWSA
ncbi:carbohydrate sulfotransferase 9 [Patella vulgata]|uniref:carbohydrate sulfotransferase 9 n=1 Tax=Patella vulgata TaxID=6465 RepID=UPI00217F81B2|nr:carbohydrate sulfotransferase 9 [Patella vulgata]